MNFTVKKGPFVLFALCLVPILLWLGSVGITYPFTSFGIFVASCGKAAALAGLTLFCINPILSMRHPLIESVLGGLDQIYKLHAKSGKLSFFLILLHPILLGFGRLFSGRSIDEIWDWNGMLVWSGILALLAAFVLTAIAVYGHIRHQQWVMIHRLFGLLIPIYFLHALIAKAQITRIPALFIFMVALGTLGFCAFLYRSVFGRLLINKFQYIVSEVNPMQHGIVEIVLKPRGATMHFQAGQYAFVSFQADGIDPEPHPFSFSNAHNGPYVRFTIKALGDDTKNFQHITTGTPALLEGPYGTFSYTRVPNRKQVWIAGGIGITPFLSMARSFSGKQHFDIRFFYGAESLDEAVFLQEFIDITRHLPENFDTKVVAKNISGLVTIDLLRSSLGDLKDWDYLICGPPPMMKSLKTQLQAAGVSAEKIHIEDFSF